MLKWDAPLGAIRDRRRQGRIPTQAVVRAIMAMCFCRLGSLNALEQTADRGLWRRWLETDLPSADTLGRVADLIELEDMRSLCHHVYERLKRGKALPPPGHGLIAAVVDGHETHASYRRHCPGCLQRKIQTAGGERIQYYHRLVALSLVTRNLRFLLDAEPIRPGEDEVAAALRLLDRVLEAYPRAFDLVQGDGLYADSRLFNWAIDHGKDALAVLKDERRDLWQDAQQLMDQQAPTAIHRGRWLCECWDESGFTTWPQVKTPVRVVRSRETRSVKRQLDGERQTQVADWCWVTTLAKVRAGTAAVVQIGHHRWDIENQGFNELANQYHADHVYRHQPTAMLVFWLLTQLCLNVFTAFFRRNLKPALNRTLSMLHIARLMLAELYHPPSARGP